MPLYDMDDVVVQLMRIAEALEQTTEISKEVIAHNKLVAEAVHSQERRLRQKVKGTEE